MTGGSAGGTGTGAEHRSLLAILAAALVLGALSLFRSVTRNRRPTEPGLINGASNGRAATNAVSTSAASYNAAATSAAATNAGATNAGATNGAPLLVPVVAGGPVRRPPSVFDAWAPLTESPATALGAPTRSSVEPFVERRLAVAVVDERLGPTGDDSETGFRAYKWRVFVAIGTAFFTIVMASTMVFVLLSAIADDFGVTLRAVGWVVIIESLIISALLLPMGAVADALGRRRVYVAGLVVFGVGSIMSGLAPSFAALIAARMVMAVGNAGVQSVITGMLVAAFPPEERGRAMGAQTTAVSIGAACGPLVGGLALQVISWKTLFLLLGIPVAVSIVAALVILNDDRAGNVGTSRAFDRVGSLLSAAIVVVLVFTISNPLAFDWLSVSVLAGALLVVVLLIAFVRWELRQPAPMIELRLFAIPAFRWAVLVRFLGFIGYATTALLLPIYLVSFRGLSTGVAGSILFLVAAGTGVSAQVSGNLYDWIGPRAPTIVGLIGQILVAMVLVVFGESLSTAVLMLVVFLSGVSSALWNVPNNSAMMGAVPPESLGVIGAFTNVVRTMGSVLGQAITTAVVVAVMAGRGFDVPLSEISETAGAGAAFFGGWEAAYVVVAVASAVALIAALRLPSRPIGVRPKETL